MASRRGIAKFLVKFIASGSVARKPGSGRLSKATAEVRKIIEEAMRTDTYNARLVLLYGYLLPMELCGPLIFTHTHTHTLISYSHTHTH